MDKVSQSRGRMVFHQPFFATILLSTPAIPDTSPACPTAYTDMRTIHYNPDFMNSLELDVVIFVWVHEVLHIALSHGLRRGNRDIRRWNRACDYVVNLICRKAGLKLWEHCLIDDRFDGMSAEQVYEILEQEDEARGEQGPSDPLGDDVHEPAGANDPAQVKEIERQIKQRIAAAANTGRLAGSLSAELDRLVNSILNPCAPWEELLAEFMTRVSRDDESWNRRNRRFTDIYLPTLHNVRLGEIVNIGDTSGSISDDELCKQANEVSYIAERLRPERIRQVWWDAKLCSEQVFEDGEQFDPKPVGGGGTRMDLALEYVEEFDPAIVILFTDGETPWPKSPPPFPLIVCCSTQAPVPDYANVVRI